MFTIVVLISKFVDISEVEKRGSQQSKMHRIVE